MKQIKPRRNYNLPADGSYDTYYDDNSMDVQFLSDQRKFGPVLIDALCFTVPYGISWHWLIHAVLNQNFGFEFKDAGHGRYHYDFSWLCEKTKSLVCFGGDRQKGTTYVSLTGTAMRMLYRDSKVYQFIREMNKLGSKFNRIDIAKDDFSGVFNIYDIVKDGIPYRFSSNASTFELRAKEYMDPFHDYEKRYKAGWTLYIGLRSSECFVRIYDKRLEQKLDKVIPYWVRVEFEIKRGTAHEIVQRLLNGIKLDYIFCQLCMKKCRLLAEKYSGYDGGKSMADIDPDFRIFMMTEDGSFAEKTSFANNLTIINYMTYLVRCQEQISSRAAALVLNHSPDEPLSSIAVDLINIFNDKHKDMLVRIGVHYDSLTGESKYQVFNDNDVVVSDFPLLKSFSVGVL